MAKRLRVKHKKSNRDKARAYKEGKIKKHKIDDTRSKRALLKKAYQA